MVLHDFIIATRQNYLTLTMRLPVCLYYACMIRITDPHMVSSTPTCFTIGLFSLPIARVRNQPTKMPRIHALHIREQQSFLGKYIVSFYTKINAGLDGFIRWFASRVHENLQVEYVYADIRRCMTTMSILST